MPEAMKHFEKTILTILEGHKGKDNPITVRELERLTLASSRKIRRVIADLVIIHGVPIASSVHYPFGFYLITDKAEALQCLSQYWSRVKEVANRAKVLSRVVEDKFGVRFQMEFDFDEDREYHS